MATYRILRIWQTREFDSTIGELQNSEKFEFSPEPLEEEMRDVVTELLDEKINENLKKIKEKIPRWDRNYH